MMSVNSGAYILCCQSTNPIVFKSATGQSVTNPRLSNFHVSGNVTSSLVSSCIVLTKHLSSLTSLFVLCSVGHCIVCHFLDLRPLIILWYLQTILTLPSKHSLFKSNEVYLLCLPRFYKLTMHYEC
jgi:hypothetical protein